jgi:hypothetical protein
MSFNKYNTMRNKDIELLAEAYTTIVKEGLMEQGINAILDLIETKFPDLYKSLMAVNSAEELESMLKSHTSPQHESLNESIVDTVYAKLKSAVSTPAAITALGLLGMGATAAAAGSTDATTTAGQAAVIGAGYGATALAALYGAIKARHGWTKSVNVPKTGSELMKGVEAKREERGPAPKM